MTTSPATPHPDDLRLFLTVVRRGGFSAAATELGLSTAGVSKRVRLLEAQLGATLLHRTTRRIGLTPQGEQLCLRAQPLLDAMDDLVGQVSAVRAEPRGALRVCSSFGFGRRHVAPALAALARACPRLTVRFEVLDRLVDIAAEGYDLDIRVGDEIAPQWVAHRLAANHRVLCAAPDYLARREPPRSPAELAGHDCLVVRERDRPFGVWRLQHAQQGEREQTVRVTGPLSTNHGEIAVDWALQGHGIVLRSLWDVAAPLAEGRLVQLLPDWRQNAGIWAVHAGRADESARLRVAVDFLADWFARSAQLRM